jgi:hypothetical protein
MKDMLMQIKAINKSGHKMIYYEAKDFPPFHYFQFPELAAFKYFFWMRTILSYPEYNKMQYEDHELHTILNKTGMEIIRNYNTTPSAEIWSVETINSTLRQIEYYANNEVFSRKETIEQIYDQLTRMIDHVKMEAEIGEKLLLNQKPLGNENYKLYFNELYLGHNTIMTEMDEVTTIFINHGILNYMITRDKRFCSYTRKYFENTMHKSTLISSVSEKERNKFFNILYQKIAHSKKNTLAIEPQPSML